MPSAYQIQGQTQYSWTDATALSNLVLNTSIAKPAVIPPGHVLVRIRAAALNARDNMVIAHDPAYPGPHAKDLVPCADGAGEIEEVGQGSKWKTGDKVIIHPCEWLDWTYESGEETMAFHELKGLGGGSAEGTLREYGVFRDDHLVRGPSNLSFEEMASLPGAGATAMHALFFGPRAIKPGQVVLTQGTGGVSVFAIQLAAAAGATVIATSSSDAKLEVARKLGASHTINYRTHPDWEAEVLRQTNGRGANIVIEVAGAKTIQQSIAASARGGIVAVIGFLTGGKEVDLNNVVMPIILRGITVYGIAMFTRGHLEALTDLVEKKNLHPKIGAVYEWADAKKAFTELSSQRTVGKIVVRVGNGI